MSQALKQKAKKFILGTSGNTKPGIFVDQSIGLKKPDNDNTLPNSRNSNIVNLSAYRKNVRKTLRSPEINPQSEFNRNDNTPISTKPKTRPGETAVVSNQNTGDVEIVNGVAVSKNTPKSQRGGELVTDQLELSDETASTLGPNIKKELTFNYFDKKTANDNEGGENFSEIQNFYDQYPSDDGDLLDENNYVDSTFIIPPFKSEEDESEVLRKIQHEMKKHSIHVTLEEARILRMSNFKVEFPYTLLLSSIAKWFQEMVFLGTGLVLSAASATSQITTDIASWIPIVGQIIAGFTTLFVGLPLFVMGLAITIFGIILNIFYKIIFFTLSYYYTQSALDFSKKIGVMRKIVARMIIRRMWTGPLALIPLVSGLVDVILTFYFYFFMKRIAKKAKVAVRKAFE